MTPTTNFAYLPQHSAELERAALGLMLTSASALRDALPLLRGNEQVFYHPQHRVLFRAMLDLHAAGLGVDYVTLMQRLASDGALAAAGGADAVKALSRGLRYDARIDDYCQFMLHLWGKRQVAELMTTLVQGAHDPTTDLHELLAAAGTALYQVQHGMQITGPVQVADLVDEVVTDIERAASQPGGLTGVPSGLVSLDAVTGGWQPSDLIIVAARPGVGKTSFALAQTIPASLAGFPGAVFNLEMNNRQMVRKMLATELGEYSTSQLQKGYFPAGGLAEAQTIRHRVDRLRQVQVYLDETPGLSISEFRGKAARLKAEHDIRWIIVDYLQLMSAGGKGNREQEIAAISRGLKLTAKELNVPVIALSQLSRAVEGRGGEKKPMLSDLRESGSIEQDADVVIFLYRPEYYGVKEDEQGQSVADTTDVIFAKHRNGPLTEVTVGSTMKNGRYFDLDDAGFAPMSAPVSTEQFGPRILGQQSLRTAAPSEFSTDETTAY